MIANNAVVKDSVIGKSIKVYSFAELKECVLGDYVTIGSSAILNKTRIESNMSINRSNYLLRSSVGKFTYTGMGCSIRSSSVGRFCSLAWNVPIGGGNHEFQHVTTSPKWRFRMLDQGGLDHDRNNDLSARYEEFDECRIGNDVWIGINAVILRGVTVGHGAIIGAGALVTKSVAPYTIVAGVPATVVRARFNELVVNSLLESQWWDWPVEVIRQNLDLIYSTKVDEKVIERLRAIAKTF